MKHYKSKNWKYNPSLEGLLFFFQRMNEMLFHYSLDTYKYSVLNTRNLAQEYRVVYWQINEDLLDNKNELPILEELLWSLRQDRAAQTLLTEQFVTMFLKNVGSMAMKQKFDYIDYIYRKLGRVDTNAKLRQ